MSDPTPLPGSSALDRILSTARLAGSAAHLGARRLLQRDEGPADAALGEALAAEMDRMKGMAMKLGQILSYFEGVLPPVTHEALRVLQRGTVQMPEEKVRAILEEAFGAPLETLFESFSSEPVAAASIGQVHRARYDGREVAVKVQYPAVAEAIESDFARLETLARLASVATAVDGPAIARELRDSVREECDYRSEALAQDAFRGAWASDSEVRIPEVISNPNLRRLAICPAWVWLQRLQWGLHAVLMRLDAEGEFGPVLRSAMDAGSHPTAIAATQEKQSGGK